MKTMTMWGRALLVCASVAAGCGSPDPGGVDRFIKALAAAQCSWEFRCCTDAEIQQQEMGKFKDQATCEQFHQLALEDTMYAERLAVRQSRVKVDGTQADACAAEQMNRACNSATGMTTPPPPGTVDPCTLVFKGATAVGDECQFATECVKGAHCVPTGASGGQGVCVPYQEEKQICNASSDCDPSVANLYCAKQDFQCHLRSPVGGACAYKIDPTTSMPTTPLQLECDNSTGTVFCDPASMTCKNLPASGEACLVAPLPPGVFNACRPGLVCDMAGGTGGTCRGPGQAGDDCTRIACDPTLFCDRTVTPNTCKALPTLGEQCQAASFQCAKPYYCNTAMTPFVCAAPAQLGQPCSNSILCDTALYCDTAVAMPTCKSKLADGSSCTQSKMCLSNQCSFAGGTGLCVASLVTVQCTGR
ncbi:MAG: hypothetical protein JWM53_2671 [bacterium]|nr:hypothetical protein [bacterium]